jgi:hypothetical protein
MAAALLLLAVAACGGVSAGSALDTRDTEQFGLVTVRAGTEIGIDFAFVQNISSTPITLLDVTLVGTGNGTVIRPVEMKIAVSNRSSVGRTAYIEDPPVFYDGNGRCDVQDLSSKRSGTATMARVTPTRCYCGRPRTARGHACT